MSDNPLRRLGVLGQSVWLDYIRRSMIESGELESLVREDGLTGITSNPAIFEEAINHHDDYDGAIAELATKAVSVSDLYDALIFGDICAAADILRPVYQESVGADGFVSVEVSPHLARDTAATIAEAHRIWARLDRPNILIKVPGTREGVDAVRELIAVGININITLLFSLRRYEMVAQAYFDGLEKRIANSKSIKNITSVASFFLSRIDTLVDERLDSLDVPEASCLKGRAAIASAKLAYQLCRQIKSSDRWQKLAASGGRPQRLLWASMSAKNPNYSDVKYVEALIGPETIATLPMPTLQVFRDHGQAGPSLETDVEEAGRVFRKLRSLGIDLDHVAAELEEDGIRKFVEPFDALMQALEKMHAIGSCSS